uniref:Ig-like domain-containing protein n=1 Tax=Callorhinchus milii TaxID=7868 RepID=A0A4W3GIL7_CALMI
MGTVGESVMLLCPLPSPDPVYKLVNVTWVRKEPYSHLVTFRQEGGSWNKTEGDERCELRGSVADGDITLTVSRLVTEDNGIYLCLVEAEKENKRLVIQREIRVQVQSSTGKIPLSTSLTPHNSNNNMLQLHSAFHFRRTSQGAGQFRVCTLGLESRGVEGKGNEGGGRKRGG